jgi:hypothetical protein
MVEEVEEVEDFLLSNHNTLLNSMASSSKTPMAISSSNSSNSNSNNRDLVGHNQHISNNTGCNLLLLHLTILTINHRQIMEAMH